MKPTKMRNMQIYMASLSARSKQLASHLSKDLRKKYNKRSVRTIEGDTVQILRGEYKDITGKVVKADAAEGTLAIEGIKKEKGKGEKTDVMIHASNVIITALDTSDKWRRSRLEGKDAKSHPVHQEAKPESTSEETKVQADDTIKPESKVQTDATVEEAKPESTSEETKVQADDTVKPESKVQTDATVEEAKPESTSEGAKVQADDTVKPESTSEEKTNNG